MEGQSALMQLKLRLTVLQCSEGPGLCWVQGSLYLSSVNQYRNSTYIDKNIKKKYFPIILK